MEGLFFNIDNGYLEALVRGHKNSLLTASQYTNLTQCDTLDDIKLQLSATEYSDVLSDINETLTTSVIEKKLNKKLVEDFNYLKSQSSGTMAKFIEFMTYGYMIDNVLLIITGTIHNRDKGEILSKCHPFGWFDTLPALSIATDLTSLYESVLIDTPLAKYFHGCLLTIDDLDDLNIEIVRNMLYRAYLEDFYDFCLKELPNPSDEIMSKLLNFEADKRSINIALNSLDTELSIDDKERMMPTIGSLASNDSIRHQLITSDNLESLQLAINGVGLYSDLFNNDDGEGSSTLEDKLYSIEMSMNRDAFAQQFTISTVYAFVRSREQEIRNLAWVCECIAQGQRGRINNYVAVY